MLPTQETLFGLPVLTFLAIFLCIARGYMYVHVSNATFNNFSVILWWSVLLAEETRVSGENH